MEKSAKDLTEVSHESTPSSWASCGDDDKNSLLSQLCAKLMNVSCFMESSQEPYNNHII